VTSCTIDGKRCTKCCQAIWVSGLSAKFIDGDDIAEGDTLFARENWTRITTEQAEQINPYMVERMRKGPGLDNSAFYTCKNLTEDGCGVYDSRPVVCSGYPIYHHHPDLYELRVIKHNIHPEYDRRCTEWPLTIPVVNI